ncbi:unnamed protein product [Gongylonema pulchrum]|uniref:Transmembrane protein n=1 Tax=Gongylonema pulchrum TaxID=637853 RepID=A0A183D071_9BILA|nr:unnamed protein product [Gongylonema pulchrum]
MTYSTTASVLGAVLSLLVLLLSFALVQSGESVKWYAISTFTVSFVAEVLLMAREFLYDSLYDALNTRNPCDVKLFLWSAFHSFVLLSSAKSDEPNISLALLTSSEYCTLVNVAGEKQNDRSGNSQRGAVHRLNRRWVLTGSILPWVKMLGVSASDMWKHPISMTLLKITSEAHPAGS